jgi:hypothetical protein
MGGASASRLLTAVSEREVEERGSFGIVTWDSDVTRARPALRRQSTEFHLKSEQAYAPEKFLETLIGAVPVERWIQG